MSPPSSGSKNKPRSQHDVVTSRALLMEMEAKCSSETSVDFQQTTQHYIPEDRTLHSATLIQSLCLKCRKVFVYRTELYVTELLFLRPQIPPVEKHCSPHQYMWWSHSVCLLQSLLWHSCVNIFLTQNLTQRVDKRPSYWFNPLKRKTPFRYFKVSFLLYCNSIMIFS
jgi:hypothetical protein